MPRDRPCVNLYKVSVREDLYVEGHEHFIDITNDPNVDGVYELQVCPLHLEIVATFQQSALVAIGHARNPEIGENLHQ